MAIGEACDLGDGFFDPIYTCLPRSAPAMLCGSCDNHAGPFCAGTTYCLTDTMGLNGKCARYCCDDGDCGGGKCDQSNVPVPGTVGLCMDAIGAGIDPTCASDGGGPPTMAPSNGACFTIPGVPSGDAGAG
jgi:hypothetical protein